MGNCVLHVGMHKTGTSSIQQSLKGYADDRFVYPDLDGHPNHGRALYKLLGIRQGGARPGLRQDQSLADLMGEKDSPDPVIRKELERQMGSLQSRSLLISGEAMMFLSVDELRELSRILLGGVERLEVVAYVRTPGAYMASLNQQLVKGGSRARIDPGREYVYYRESFSKFDDVFGRENVHLWKFDPGSFTGGDVVQDFCRRLGIALPADRIVRTNEAISREVFSLLLIYRKEGKHLGSMAMSPLENVRLVTALQGIGSTKFSFAPELVRPVFEEHRSDIAWMEERLGQPLAEDMSVSLPGAVRTESDLLRPDPVAVRQLLELLGNRVPQGVQGETPEEVAVLVHALRELMAERALTRPQIVRPADLLAYIRREHAAMMEGLSESKAEAMILGVLRQLNETLANTEEDTVRYAGLGRFEVKKAGETENVQQPVRRRIVFHCAESGRDARGDGRSAGQSTGTSAKVSREAAP